MKTITKLLLITLMCIGFSISMNAQYCAGGPSSSYDSNVQQVDITGESATSISHTGCGGSAGGGTIGAQDLTSQSVDLTVGNNYNLSVTFGTCGSNYEGVGEVWIDWNQDFIFDAATESIGTSSGTVGVAPWNAPVVFNFTVPAGAGNGNTRMRIMQNEGGSFPINPCSSYSWGSVMDFSVDISGGVDLCSFYPTNLTATGITTIDADLEWTQYGSGTTWNIEWGVTGFTQGSGTMITGTTANPYNLSGLTESTTYDFYVQTDCGGAGQSAWSGPHTFSTIASCLEPTTLTATNITETTVDLGWTEAGTAATWNIEWGTTGFTQGSGTMITGTATNPYNLSGLVAQTTYSFYVQSDCGGDQSTWAGPFSFTTACATVTVFPHLEDFSSWPPTCWDLTGGSQTCSPYGGNAIEASFWSWSTGQTALMTSPVFDVSTLTSPELLFDWSHLYNSSYPTDQLEVLISDDAGATWTQIWNNAGTALNSNDGATSTAPGSFVSSGSINIAAYGNTILIRFNFVSGYGPDCFLDNVQIREAPTCLAPTNQVASNITAVSADLGWTESASAATWNVEWGTAGFIQGAGTLVSTGSNPHFLSGLSESTNYDFYVQADCGAGDESFWAGPFSFTTTAACPVPTGLGAIPTDIDASLSWTGYAATTWDIEWGEAPFTPTGTPTIEDVSANPYNLTGLTAYTDYAYYVRADCGAEQTTWVGPFTFTTQMTPLSNPTTCGVGYFIESSQCLDIPIDVSGVTGTQLGIDVLLKAVKLIATHSYSADLDITLESPNGITVELTTDNGSSGDNYGVDDGSCSQFTKFVMCVSNPITGGSSPFVGEYNPEGNFNSFNDNSDPNGIWILHVCDDAGGDEGSFEFAELVFGLDGTNADFDTFSFADEFEPATIDDIANTINIIIGNGTDLTTLVADFSLTTCASADITGIPQTSGVTPNNFTSPVTYTLTGEDGLTTEDWLVTVTEAPINTETDIISYIFIDQTAPATIDPIGHTVNINIHWQANITNLISTFALSYGATADILAVPQVSGTTPNDFTSPVIYTITAEDMITVQAWTINVTQDPPPLGAYCTNPIPITLPIVNEGGTTVGFGDDYDTDPCGSSYLGGNDIFYEFTIEGNGIISGDITVTSAYVGFFIYDGCPDDPTTNCVASGLSSSTTFAEFIDIPISGGTYQIVIASWPSPQTVDYDFNLTYTALPTVVWDATSFAEDIANDGSTSDIINLTLTDESLTTTGLLTEATHYTVANVPPGLTVEIDALTVDTAVLRLTGNALNHLDSDDITNMEITFLDAAFTGGVAADVTAFSQTSVIVDFFDFTDLDIVFPETASYGCDMTGSDVLPICITNIGDVTILTGDTIFIYYEYPAGTIVQDTIELWFDLATSDTICYDFNQTVDFSAISIYDFEMWLQYDDDENAMNDTLIATHETYEITVDLSGVNDTIIAASWPVTLDAGACSVPGGYTCSYLWSTTEITQTIDVSADGWYYVNVDDDNACGAEDSVFIQLDRILSWDATTFVEPITNNGSISTVLNLTLTNETFTTTGILTEVTHYDIANVPPGLTVEIDATSVDAAEVRLTGNATNHLDSDDIANMEITFLDAAFTNGVASIVTNYSQIALVVDFMDVTDLDIVFPEIANYGCDMTGSDVIPICITNIGDLTIPTNDTIFIFYEYPIGSIVEDTIVLAVDLAFEDTICYDFNQTVDFSAIGIYDFNIWFQYDEDENAINNLLAATFETFDYAIELGGINDTLEVPSYPVFVDAGDCAGPPTSICSYDWSTMETTQTIEVIADGWYYATVTNDYGCIAIDSIYVVLSPQIALIDLNSEVEDFEVCIGDDEATAIAGLVTEITITDSNAGEHLVTLSWSIDSYDSNTAGMYNATGTFNLPIGVEQTDPETTLEVVAIITVNELPIVTCPETVNVAVDEPITLSGALPTGGEYSGTGVTAGEFDPSGLANDTYVIIYTYIDPITGCIVICNFDVIVDIGSAIHSLLSDNINIYPNPTKGLLTIEFGQATDEPVKVEIINNLGQTIRNEEFTQKLFDVNLSNEKPGLYLIRLMYKGEVLDWKIIKE